MSSSFNIASVTRTKQSHPSFLCPDFSSVKTKCQVVDAALLRPLFSFLFFMVFRGSAVSTARLIFTRVGFVYKPSLGHPRPPTCGARFRPSRPFRVFRVSRVSFRVSQPITSCVISSDEIFCLFVYFFTFGLSCVLLVLKKTPFVCVTTVRLGH